MTPVKAAAAMVILIAFLVSPALAQEKQIEMLSVKYDGLKQEVLKHRGKVLLVDFWAGY